MSKPTAKSGLWRGIWDHWQQLARAIGVVQTRVLMIVFYFIIVLPTGLFARATDDKLRLRRPAGTCWVPHPPTEQNIDTAHNQF